MSRAGLQHLREGQVLTGVALTRAEAVALTGTRLVTATPQGDGWRVTAGHRVGAVRCGDLDVRVAPKVGPVHVLRLLARAHGVRGFTLDPNRIALAGDADVSTVLAVLFEYEASAAITQRPTRGYRTEDQSLPVVRGRIRLVDQALRRFGQVSPIEVTVDEWTLDTDENRRILAATHVLLALPGVPAPVRAGLQRLDRLLTEVHLPPRGTRLPPWKPTRLNTHLHQLLHLADLALGGASVEHRAGDVVAHGFVINMAWVFETLIARLLTEHCRRTGSGRLLAQHTLPLDAAGNLTIRPDLVITTGTTYLAVADTKYKLLDEHTSLPNPDAYQMLAYCTRLDLPVGHLIYASPQRRARLGPHTLTGSGVSLLIHHVDLRQELTAIEAQVDTILTRMLHDQAPVPTAPRRMPGAPDGAFGEDGPQVHVFVPQMR